jgi:uncharacterized protein (TIGR02246 family)
MKLSICAAVLLVVTGVAQAQEGKAPPRIATPEAVVQRFVDAANARDADAMAALVAPDALFARFPGGQVIAQKRDGIREHYSRQLRGLPGEFQITVRSRIVEGQFVIDQERFTAMPDGRQQATWMYLVRDGLIHRAWVLDGQAKQP